MAAVTPEEARKLLEGITPGPWEFKTDVADMPGGSHEIGHVVQSGDTVLFESWGDANDTHPGNLALAAAAPELAETVAGLRTEWAICRLVYQGGKHLKPLYDYWSSDKEGWQYFSADATWCDSYLDAEEEAERYGLEGYLLVKRLVGPAEVG